MNKGHSTLILSVIATTIGAMVLILFIFNLQREILVDELSDEISNAKSEITSSVVDKLSEREDRIVARVINRLASIQNSSADVQLWDNQMNSQVLRANQAVRAETGVDDLSL